MDSSGRNDRLVKKANKLFEEYYKSKPTEDYGGFDIDELSKNATPGKKCVSFVVPQPTQNQHKTNTKPTQNQRKTNTIIK